jgi:hypothetical protein
VLDLGIARFGSIFCMHAKCHKPEKGYRKLFLTREEVEADWEEHHFTGGGQPPARKQRHLARAN